MPQGGFQGYREAGLPNITGRFGYSATSSTTDWSASVALAEGAFSGTGYYSGRSLAGAGSSIGTNRIVSMNASKSSSIYGLSTTVQPAAVGCAFIVKY